MRISDWSSDVCSSDRLAGGLGDIIRRAAGIDGDQVQFAAMQTAGAVDFIDCKLGAGLAARPPDGGGAAQRHEQADVIGRLVTATRRKAWPGVTDRKRGQCCSATLLDRQHGEWGERLS